MQKDHIEQLKIIHKDIEKLDNRQTVYEGKFDKHMEIYQNNGKELAAVKTNQTWMMRLTWAFMTPTISGIVYLIIRG